MKPLAEPSKKASSGDLCAEQVLTTVPTVMRRIRDEMRERRPEGLSVPQFRALGFLHRRGNVSLSDVAERMGLRLPTVSKMMDTMVKRGFVAREGSPTDRRCVVLSLTGQGKSVYLAAERYAQSRLAESLTGLSPSERCEVIRAMHALRRVFSSSR